MSGAASISRTQPRLAWTLWVLLSAAMLPVCEAQGFWVLALAGSAASALGIWLTGRAGRPLLGQRTAAAIAVALGAVAVLVSQDGGMTGMYAVADWLIAVAVLKSWQLGGSRDCSHVLIVTGLLLLVGSLVSWQLAFAISLVLAVILMPSALAGWHLLGQRERQARLAGWTNGAPGQPHAEAQRPYRLGVAASVFCSVVAFVIFATFPRLRTPLQPAVNASVQPVTGFSAEARLNDIGRLQTSERVVMRVRLKVMGQPLGSEALQDYFRGMVYHYYNGRSWENRQARPPRRLQLPDDGSLRYFHPRARQQMPGGTVQEYVVESGPLPCLLAAQTPVALGSQDVQAVDWAQRDDVLLPVGRVPAALRYTVLSVPPYMLNQTPADPAGQTAAEGPATLPSLGPPPRVHPPFVQPSVIRQAQALASQVTDQVDNPPPEVWEQIVGQFMRYLQGPEFSYTLDPPPRARGFGALEQFLAVKRGYCEYYATALAVFCQSVGIPARYVTGFRGGTYNDVGQFYAVRDSDAHSWVEVWLPDRGWTTFDPTPSEQRQYRQSSLRSRMAGLLDYLQFQWSNWVVAYDVLHRKALLGSVGDWMQNPSLRGEHSWVQFLWMFRELLMGPESLSPLGKILYWMGLLGVLGLTGYLVVQLFQQVLRWWTLRRRMQATRQAGVRFYERTVSALAQRRIVRQPAETPREFASRVEQCLPQLQGRFLELIEQYYAVRYGARNAMQAGEKASREILDRLERGAVAP